MDKNAGRHGAKVTCPVTQVANGLLSDVLSVSNNGEIKYLEIKFYMAIQHDWMILKKRKR